MIYNNLSTDEISQLEFQAGKKATEIIDTILGDNKEIKEQVCEFTDDDNGKILQVGAEGKIVALESSEGLTIDPTLSVNNSAADAGVVGDKLAELKSQMDIFALPEPLSGWYVGKYYNTPSSVTTISPDNRSNSSSYNCQSVACEPGDVFYITGTGGSGGKLWVWINSENTILDRAASNAVGTDLKLVAPAGAAYLLTTIDNTKVYSLIYCPKMRAALTFDTVADMQAFTDFRAGMTVKCLGYNAIGDGMGCTYRISDDVAAYAYTGRIHIGSTSYYAIPILPISLDNNKPGGAVADIVRLADTYMASGKQFVYAADNEGTTYPTCFSADYAADTYYINCSTLSRLIMYGIDFASSKYGGGDNTHGEGYAPAFDTRFSFSSAPVASAHEQALYFAYRGMAYEPNSDYSNIRVGDLCFFSNTVADNNAIYRSIDHVAIYLGAIPGVDGNGNTLYMFIGNDGSASARTINTFFYVGSASYMSKIVLCAGFAKPLVQDRPEQIVSDPYTARQSTSGAQTIYQYALAKELESFKTYTLITDISDIPAGLTLDFRVDNTAQYFKRYANISTMRPTKLHNVFHLMTGDLSGLTAGNRKVIRVYRSPTNNTITLNQFRVYDGWI